MSDASDRIEGLLHAQSLMLQDLYTQIYSRQPSELSKCQEHLTNMLKYKWEMPAGSSERDADAILRIQPLAIAELERSFAQIRKMIHSLPPLSN
ncbi:hypothetical protein C4K35_4187 [Pseudomonas chlororaphis subsp. piscium]|uniref:hypothetical protein n=1 Tax=Pseudomonas chlororaphis TaxID=587753 RepID=UPI000F565DA9|nr:hypothetical protein [Pseudomonas chlororaphis]AZC51762.1 hypothetical protein C4K35_4187 [Pseudomonas chlororaphis subsp. piscium]